MELRIVKPPTGGSRIDQELADQAHELVEQFFQEHQSELPQRIEDDLEHYTNDYQHELVQRLVTIALMLDDKDEWEEKPPDRFSTITMALVSYLNAYPFKNEPDLAKLLRVEFGIFSFHILNRWKNEKLAGFSSLVTDDTEDYFD